MLTLLWIAFFCIYVILDERRLALKRFSAFIKLLLEFMFCKKNLNEISP